MPTGGADCQENRKSRVLIPAVRISRTAGSAKNTKRNITVTMKNITATKTPRENTVMLGKESGTATLRRILYVMNA